jgi:transcriptional regulator with XRE-family HTH domain
MPSVDPGLLRAAREQAGLSREFVAISLGRSHRTIVAYESGQACPPGGVLVRLAALYRVPVEALCRDDAPAGAR